MSRMDVQRDAEPQLVATVALYPTADGGRREPMMPGFLFPVTLGDTTPLQVWDALPLLRDDPFAPGETRRIGFVFLAGEEAATELRHAGKFYLWDGRFIGEAIVEA